MMPENSAKADETTKWAIVIHGGAGGGPSKWGEDKTQARKAGLERALRAGKSVLADGGAAIDAVEAAIKVMEDDASFNAGRGAVLTKDGEVELDASIMDGKTRSCGAVAGVTKTRNPISLARIVMSKTRHVLLAGPGADEFAKQQNVPLVDPDYFLGQFDNTYQRVDPLLGGDGDDEPHFGTVGCVALDQNGNLAAGTSTGGTSKKLPGRVGDSPIVGAGTYASNDVCAVSGTGIGEEYIRNSVAYDIAAQMRYAHRSLLSAVSQVMRVTLEPGVGGVIAVDRDGAIVMQHNTPGMSCGAADSGGRFETHFVLANGGQDELSANEVSRDGLKEPDGLANTLAIKQITQLIQKQAADWSEGDIDAFMSAYWRSDELTFSSGGKVTRGWDATIAGYKERYPTKELMGRTTFSDLEFLPLAESAMQVIGTWRLEREQNPIGGKFTLILRKLPAGWRIVHDHTSVLATD